MSPLAFVLAFVGGLMLWFGIGFVSMLGKTLYGLLTGRRQWRRRHSRAMEAIPPGYEVFLPLALGFGLLAGMATGLASGSTSLWLSCAAHLTAGAAYGGALRALARHGYLPFPEPG